MSQVDKAVELYRLMAERCDRNGLSPNQAAVYSEMAEFTSRCKDIDEATAAIKNSRYYLAPTEALVRDRIEAQIKAARENEMPEVVEVYEKKLAAIDADQGEMYTAGYETTAQNIKAEYINTIQAFIDIYRVYVSYLIEGEETYLRELKTDLGNLRKPSDSFETLAVIPKFRDMIDLRAAAYEKYVEAVAAFEKATAAAGVNDTDALKSAAPETLLIPSGMTDEAKQAWEELRAAKDEVKAIGRKHNSEIKKANAIATAPEWKAYKAAEAAGKQAEYTFEKE